MKCIILVYMSKYNYPLHDLNVELSFSWCLIMLITIKLQKYFSKGESLVCGFDEIHCQRGRNFHTPTKGGEIFHIFTHHIFTFLHNFLFVFWVCVFVHIFLDLFLIQLFFTFSFQNLENLKVK